MKTLPRRGSLGTGLSSARERFEARAARARRRPFLLAGALALALLLAGALIWLGWVSSVLAVTQVRVEGVAAADAKVVREVARVPLGAPLMRVDTDAITTRLESDRAWTDITVRRSLPHAVVIKLAAREPVLALRNSKGQLELVDSAGVRFRAVAAPPKGVPVVAAGSSEVTTQGLRAALAALQALPSPLRTRLTSFSLNAADQVSFTLSGASGPRTVVWGGAGQEQTKARLVTILLGQPGARIDVSVPEAPVTQ